MEFLHSDCVPGELGEKVIAAHKLHQESEEAEGMSAWLRDVGATACTGGNLYELINQESKRRNTDCSSFMSNAIPWCIA